MEQHHKNHLDTTVENEIQVTISYQNRIIKLYLEDDEGNGPELELNHEKLLHLIIVSEDLNEYFHLHPVQKNDQAFEIDIALTGHSYKAFVEGFNEGCLLPKELRKGIWFTSEILCIQKV